MKSDNNQKLAVLLPVYNGEETIYRTVTSLLNQTYKNFIIYVCDDGSEDKSVDIIKRLESNRIKIFKNKINQGLAYAMNKLVANVEKSSKYIAFAEQDDYYYPYRFGKQISYLNENEHVGLVSGIADHWDGKKIKRRTPGILVNGGSYPSGYEFFKYNYREQIKVVNSCIMLRKEIHLNNNLKFNEKYHSISVDWDYILRFSLVSNIGGLNIPLVKLNREPKRKSLTNNIDLKNKTANILINDFYEEFPEILSYKDHQYSLATQRYIELGSYLFFERIIKCIKIFFLDTSKRRFFLNFFRLFKKPFKNIFIKSYMTLIILNFCHSVI